MPWLHSGTKKMKNIESLNVSADLSLALPLVGE
jgi:hypothetical protein